MEKLDLKELDKVTGGRGAAAPREKYVSAFFCEYCGTTIHLNGVYTLNRAKALHNAKLHPQIKE